MTNTLAFASHGVAAKLTWSGLPPTRDWREYLLGLLPPGAAVGPAGQSDSAAPRWAGRITGEGGDYTFSSTGTGGGEWTTSDSDELDHLIESGIGMGIAELSPEAVFVHAGVVGTPCGAVMIPGRSFAGKTTLVRALLQAGCSYLSDEYAVVTSQGLVAPYPRRLSIRTGSGRERPTARDLSAHEGAAMPVAVVLRVRYQPGAELELAPLSQGHLALALIDNAVAAQVRPREVSHACATVARSAAGFDGVRGEAEAAAAAILSLVCPEARVLK